MQTQPIQPPLVSVIIPTYNRDALLQQAIASVVAQTYINWELVIVDDGSTDNTLESVKKINDRRINVISLPHTGNIGHVRNVGVEHSRGEWIAFLDSDDLWLPEKLEWQLETLTAEKKRWVYGLFEYMDNDGKIIYSSAEKFAPFAGPIIREVIMAKTGITICSVVVEKKLFGEIRGFSSYIKEDHEFLLRLALNAEAAITEKIVMQVRNHPGRTYNKVSYSYEHTADMYKAFIHLGPGKELEKLARKRLAFFLSEASIHRFSSGYYRLALQQLGRSFWMKDTPRHWLSSFKRGLYAVGKRYF